MKRIFFAFLLLSAAPAYADCAGRPDTQTHITLERVSTPVYDAAGNAFKGCLLHANGEILGYAVEAPLCQTAPGTPLDVRLSYGCCDTGPNSGDSECIIRSHENPPAHGNGVVVHAQ